MGSVALSVGDVARVARDGVRVCWSNVSQQRIEDSHAALCGCAGVTVYGVTTGLGAAADTWVAFGNSEAQRRVVWARAVGVGRFAAVDEVRAAMLARLAGFAVGCSGVSAPMADALLALLNAGVHPAMPLEGSVGEADLAPLAHIAEVLAGGGLVLEEGGVAPAALALARAGVVPPPFGPKDGLALVSSNAASSGIGALVVVDARRIFAALVASAALSLEGFQGNVAPLLPEAVALRPAPGQAAVTAAVLALLDGGSLMLPGAARLLQDPLSFRCIGPVYAACWAALDAAAGAVELELNSSDDNPALVPGAGVVPNANFDPTHMVLAFEMLGQAMARVAATLGGRVVKLMSPASSGLPRFLSPVQEGRNGLATVQKTVAALCAAIGQRTSPMPVWVLPAADGVEDYATMSLSTVEKTREILSRVRMLAAIELLVAAQACTLRGHQLAPGTARVMDAVRSVVTPLEEDRPSAPDIRALDTFIATGVFDAAMPGASS